MKIRKLNELNELNSKNEYYLIKIVNSYDNFIIPPDQSEWEQNYDCKNLEDVVRYYMEENKNYKNQLKIYKMTEEELDKNELNLLIQANKYNL